MVCRLSFETWLVQLQIKRGNAQCYDTIPHLPNHPKRKDVVLKLKQNKCNKNN